MTRLILIVVIAIALVGCIQTIPPTPLPTATEVQPQTATPQPMDVETHNGNPDLLYGGCEWKRFYTERWGWDNYEQCHPSGYTLHAKSCNELRVDVNHTGGAYSYKVGGRCGEHGLTIPSLLLPETCIAIKVIGFRHLGDNPDYTMQGNIGIAGTTGRVQFNISDVRGNGNYETVFYANIESVNTYTMSVYLVIPQPNQTTELYYTIDRIEVISVSAGHCENAPTIG
jgi:hypothetical protein